MLLLFFFYAYISFPSISGLIRQCNKRSHGKCLKYVYVLIRFDFHSFAYIKTFVGKNKLWAHFHYKLIVVDKYISVMLQKLRV